MKNLSFIVLLLLLTNSYCQLPIRTIYQSLPQGEIPEWFGKVMFDSIDNQQDKENYSKESFYYRIVNDFDIKYDTLEIQPALYFKAKDSDFIDTIIEHRNFDFHYIWKSHNAKSWCFPTAAKDKLIFYKELIYPHDRKITVRLLKKESTYKNDISKPIVNERNFIVLRYKTLKKSDVEFVYKADLNSNEKLDSTWIAAKQGYWSNFKPIQCPDCVLTESPIREIQSKLNARGYHLVEDDIMGKKTKHALIDFQKKNGLPSGNLNIETMIELEIDY